MIKKTFITLVISLFIINYSHSKENFFADAKKLFDNKKYEESKFLFQRDIVFNPKKAKSYLFLAKIFKIEKNLKEEEKNLNTAILLDPKNEEAIYLLMDIEIERSNFAKVKELKKKFEMICSNLCPKISSIDEKLKNFDTKDES
jgi:tetratricopeptide (TPR) repeat protein|tara:strand:+ start:1370 stop:1801 length:432 start_codon:yes stop_codon:yes gene_type:complete